MAHKLQPSELMQSIVSPYLEYHDCYLKLKNNPFSTLLVCSSEYKLLGTITEGDLGRATKRNSSSNVHYLFSLVARDLLNDNFDYYDSSINTDNYGLSSDSKHLLVPVLNPASRQIEGAYFYGSSDKSFSINGRLIGPSYPPYIIAEIGINHDGSLEIAKRLVLAAFEAGADAVKFQHRNLRQIYLDSTMSGTSSDLSVEYTLDHLKRTHLGFENINTLFAYARELGIQPICTPFDLTSFHEILDLSPCAIKVASADLTNLPLLKKIAESKIPMIISTGMSYEHEIAQAISLIKNCGAVPMVLHCQSTYPAPDESLQLSYINVLAERYNVPVGYSSHDVSTHLPCISVAQGACVVEKHLTYNSKAVGPDHKASLEPEQFKTMVEMIHSSWKSMGNQKSRTVSQGELLNRQNLSKSLYANTSIPKGSALHPKMFSVRSPGIGVSPMFIPRLTEYVSAVDIDVDKPLFLTHIKEASLQITSSMPKHSNWGIPVRYRDAESLCELINPNFVEFHMTYKDLQLDPGEFSSLLSKINSFKVHAPECFENDHIIDLASIDDDYRALSIKHLNNLFDHIRAMKKISADSSDSIDVVINMGGFNRDGFVSESEKNHLFERIIDSVSQLNTNTVNILPQTMPPYPWHLGGRSHHNLFLNHKDIERWHMETGFSVCLDISHTYMASVYSGSDFYELVESIMPFTSYLHVSDASGLDSEGLQIGEGDIDFRKLFAIISSNKFSYIPEIWQGHVDNASGFITALQKLSECNW